MVLSGKHIILRPLEVSDSKRIAGWYNDKRVGRFLYSGRFPFPISREEEWIRSLAESDCELGLAICLKETGRHIGNCGLSKIFSIDRVGYLFILIGDVECWSKGFGAEAACQLIDHAFDVLNLNRLELATFDFNVRAQKLFRKLGFVEEGRLRQKSFRDGAFHDEVIMGLLREEWIRNMRT